MPLDSYLAAMTDVTPGMPVHTAASSRRLNAIMGAIRALARGENLASGPGVLMSKNGTAGVTIRSTARASSGGGGSVTFMHPFKITDASAAGVAKVTVRFGQMNSNTPEIGGVELGQDPEPTLTLAVGTNVVYLRYEITSSWAFVSLTIHAASETPNDTDTEGHLSLGEVDVEADGESLSVSEIRQSVTHSLQHDMCGVGIHHFWGV